MATPDRLSGTGGAPVRSTHIFRSAPSRKTATSKSRSPTARRWRATSSLVIPVMSAPVSMSAAKGAPSEGEGLAIESSSEATLQFWRRETPTLAADERTRTILASDPGS